MPCCMCEKYEWDDPQEVIYPDPDGKEYCLFHAPAEHKYVSLGGEKMSVDDFNAQVFERIQETIDLGDEEARCGLSGTIFPGKIHFGDGLELPSIAFNEAIFTKGADFRKVWFTGIAGFINARFGDDVFFGDAHFEKFVNFFAASFGGYAGFYETCFNENSNFSSATFGGMANFRKAYFGGEGCFTAASFGENADFREAQFRQIARFISAAFEKSADFCKARFVEGTWFSFTRFGGGGDASFLETKFENGASYMSAEFEGPTFFEPKTTSGPIIFAHCAVSSYPLIFCGGDPTCLDLIQQYDLSKIHFIESPWDESGRIKARTEDGQLQLTRDFYQRMKAKYKAENNEYEASKWHIAEKEAQLKLLTQSDGEWFNWIMLSLYKLSSGFGENPWKALKVLLFVLVLPLLWVSTDVDINFFGWTLHSVQTPDVIGQWLKFISLTRAIKGTELSALRAFMFFWQFFITIQAALFAFALRNRFRR